MGASRCPGCGTPLSISRLDGLCPVCLLEDPAPEGPGEAPETGPGLMHLPGYRLTREIARGGMGIIYEALQLSPSRTVALKMLLPHLMEDPAMRERFRREAQSMAGLDHPGILPVYEVGDHNGLPYFSMKLASGGTLSAQAWRYRGEWRLMAGLMAYLADAIQMAHTHGVLHRDLKPGNILFDEHGLAYISDFGIAKQLVADADGHDLTRTATLLGTPNYLPPEWAAGTARNPTIAGDLYGMGAILYQLLTGNPPHQAGQLTTLLRQIADDPVVTPRSINPSIPRDLEIICLKVLAKDPVHRYSAAHELAVDLRLWLAGRPIRARTASSAEKLWRWSRRNPLPAALAALLAGALTFGGAALWNALQTSRLNLHDSLLAQARALRESGLLGIRTQAIQALDHAIRLQPSPASQAELSSALAMTELRPIPPFSYGSGERSNADAAFTRYTSLDAMGHLTVRQLQDRSIISRVPLDIVDPDGYGPFSPDGRFLCVRPVRKQPFAVWDCQENRFRHQAVAGTSVLFAPDSRTLAIGDAAGQLKLMDVITGAILATYDTALKPVRPYSFSPDGTHLVAGQFASPRFEVLETATGRSVQRGEHPPAARLRCAAWRPDGSGFFIGTESSKIYEWSLTGNSLPRPYIGHQNNVTALAVHPGGEWLLSQSKDGTTRIWSTLSAQMVAQLPCHGSEVRFSPDGRQLLFEDRNAQLLHLVDLIPSPVCRQFLIPHPDSDNIGTRGCWSICFSPDGALLSIGDTDGLFHFDGHTGQLLNHQRLGFCWSLAWSPDGSALFSASKSGLQCWPTARFPGPAPETPSPTAVSLSAPTISHRAPAGSAWRLLSPETWEKERPDPALPSASINHLAVSADNRTVALAYDHSLGLFDAASGKRTQRLPSIDSKLDALALSPDGSLAAASHQHADGVMVWDTASHHCLQRLPTRFAEATLCFHPDGRSLITGDLEALTCWDARSGAMRWQIPCPSRSSVSVRVALTPDGTLLAANLTPETVYLFDPANGHEITRLSHPSPHRIAGLAFSADHSRLAVLCLGHLVQLWDLQCLRQELSARSLDWAHPPLPPRQSPPDWQWPPP